MDIARRKQFPELEEMLLNPPKRAAIIEMEHDERGGDKGRKREKDPNTSTSSGKPGGGNNGGSRRKKKVLNTDRTHEQKFRINAAAFTFIISSMWKANEGSVVVISVKNKKRLWSSDAALEEFASRRLRGTVRLSPFSA